MEHAILGGSYGHRLQGEPPHWSVVAVKCCVIGILVLPLGMPLLMMASSVLGPRGDALRPIAFAVSIGLWLAMFAAAQLLTGHYPPVARRR